MRNAKVQKVALGFLLCLTVMIGYAAAQTMSDYDYIARHLDVSYGTWMDTNGDGYGNALAYDVDTDGYIDAYRFSTFTNGYLNVVVFDTSGNESFTSAKFYMDTNSTGRFNVAFSVSGAEAYVAVDPDEDTIYDPWVALHQPSLTPSEAILGALSMNGVTSPDVGTMVYGILTKGITNRWNEPACNGSINGVCR